MATARWVASVIHLTDLHLYMSADGGGRRPVEHEASIEVLLRLAYKSDSVRWRSLFVGLSEHNRAALRMLKRRLPVVIRAERRDAVDLYGTDVGNALPIVVVQTGDVEAYGARRMPDATCRFPGWEHLSRTLMTMLPEADDGNAHAWVDIFGNHDAWGGAFPLTNPRAHPPVLRHEIQRIPGLEGPWPQRCPLTFQLPGGQHLEVYRVSSVPDGWLAAVRGQGKLTRHPLGAKLPLTGGYDPLRELAAVGGETHDPLAIRLLLLHHPVHAFDAGVGMQMLGPAGFADRASVARVAGRVPFHLLIAGHRHELDPPEHAVYDARVMAQPPLPRAVGQLVAESPTQEAVVFGDIVTPEPAANSFSLYRLLIDDERRLLEVERTVFRYLDASEEPFGPSSERETVLVNLGLE